jgi:hypothetical protein
LNNALFVDRVVQSLSYFQVVERRHGRIDRDIRGVDLGLFLDAVLPGRVGGDAGPIGSGRRVAHHLNLTLLQAEECYIGRDAYLNGN